MTSFGTVIGKGGARTRFGDPLANPRFAQSQLGLEPADPRLVSIRTEALFGATAGGFVALLNTPPLVLGGGGLESVARPGRRPLTPYRSPDTMGLALSFILDGNATGGSVERECRAIERMAGMFLSNDPGPQRLIVQGKAVPHCSGAQAFTHRWLIAEQPDWGDDSVVIRRESDGHRVRQQVSLTLWLAAGAEEIDRVKERQPQPKYRFVNAKSGDTYLKVAHRELGSSRYGRRLAKLNGDSDPRKALSEGHKVKVPTATVLAEWKRDLAKAK